MAQSLPGCLLRPGKQATLSRPTLSDSSLLQPLIVWHASQGSAAPVKREEQLPSTVRKLCSALEQTHPRQERSSKGKDTQVVLQMWPKNRRVERRDWACHEKCAIRHRKLYLTVGRGAGGEKGLPGVLAEQWPLGATRCGCDCETIIQRNISSACVPGLRKG